MTKTDQGPKFTGSFKVESRDSEGNIVDTVFQKNIITYTATNVWARCLGGDTRYVPTGIKIGGSLLVNVPGSFPAVSRSDTDLSSLTDPGTAAGNVQTILPITRKSYVGVASTSAPATQQNSNVITYEAVLPQVPDDLTLNGKYYYEAGIVSEVEGSVLLFSHQFHTAIEKPSDLQLIYTWSIKVS